jgi:hypothetical protein
MTAAPTPTIDSAGVVSWVNPSVPPGSWELVSGFDDASVNLGTGNSTSVSGATTSFDAYTNAWAGGQRVQLYGLDANNNVILAPAWSLGNLTKNQ